MIVIFANATVKPLSFFDSDRPGASAGRTLLLSNLPLHGEIRTSLDPHIAFGQFKHLDKGRLMSTYAGATDRKRSHGGFGSILCENLIARLQRKVPMAIYAVFRSRRGPGK